MTSYLHAYSMYRNVQKLRYKLIVIETMHYLQHIFKGMSIKKHDTTRRVWVKQGVHLKPECPADLFQVR